ncbi:hypothetical protein AYI70_g4386 [Smittium culicis]|uniref:Uncharacterized protein n=1 Tax=Smittium culicis TaxID=133412 RepID=A0A1R1XZ86_9FUNG|nr:hypothetical protein AYI70_g4386 [Smittium culicis]
MNRIKNKIARVQSNSNNALDTEGNESNEALLKIFKKHKIDSSNEFAFGKIHSPHLVSDIVEENAIIKKLLSNTEKIISIPLKTQR